MSIGGPTAKPESKSVSESLPEPLKISQKCHLLFLPLDLFIQLRKLEGCHWSVTTLSVELLFDRLVALLQLGMVCSIRRHVLSVDGKVRLLVVDVQGVFLILGGLFNVVGCCFQRGRLMRVVEVHLLDNLRQLLSCRQEKM